MIDFELWNFMSFVTIISGFTLRSDLLRNLWTHDAWINDKIETPNMEVSA